VTKTLSLGYSTCPNDTYIFHAMVHQIVPCAGIDFSVSLKDVEALNQDARARVLDVSKLSFAALGHLNGSYGLLRSGAALGRGCGPLIISRPDADLDKLGQSRVATPGLWTTANLLLGMYSSTTPRLFAISFDKIMPAVARGDVDFGVIIHEGRFTYPDHGLVKQVDLGEWWEETTGLPIPLGGIAIKREHSGETAQKIEELLRRSVAHARSHPQASADYVKMHAQEMDDAVIAQHIDLYVNEFTVDVGREGEAAVREFFTIGARKGLLPDLEAPVFACP
jgi:5,8-dihydroxy-2-naphthoate synthase